MYAQVWQSMVHYFVRLVGCWWTAIHNNIHNSTISTIFMMSLIPVVALPLWWVYFCDGFVIVQAFASGNVAYHSWVIFEYSLFVSLTLWIWWHYCYRFVMVHIVKLLLHWCFICLENSTYNIILWWTPSCFSGGGSVVVIFGGGGGGGGCSMT